MEKYYDNLTGEEINVKQENYDIALREFNNLQEVDTWLEMKAKYDAVKEQFEMVDKPLRKKVIELFDKYFIKSLSNAYISITRRNGYEKVTWDDEKVKQLIIDNKLDVADFQTKKWVDGTLQIKYKE